MNKMNIDKKPHNNSNKSKKIIENVQENDKANLDDMDWDEDALSVVKTAEIKKKNHVSSSKKQQKEQKKTNANLRINVADGVYWPKPRMSCGIAIKGKILYLIGGLYEIGDRQITLSDMYSIDITKLDKWTLLKESDETLEEDWLSSESETESGDDDDDSDDSDID
jgi:hypothetical protein